MTEGRFITPLALLFIATIACVSIYYYLKHNPEHLLVFDDSYITLTFAANFFRYGGITYDGTSFLAGATSPLHIIFIAICSLFLDIATASLTVGTIFFILSALLVYLWTLALYNNKAMALLAGTLMATSGWLIFDALNGLETTTFIFFSLLTFYLFYTHRSKQFYVIPLYLSILTRPEGWFIACALWMWQIIGYRIHRDKQILKDLFTSLGIITLVITPYFLLSLHSTGSLLPGTAFSKAIFFAEVRWPFTIKYASLKEGFEFFYSTLLYSTPFILLLLIFFARKIISLPYLWFYYFIFYLFYFLLFPGSIKHYWCRYQHIFIPLIIMAISAGAFELYRMCRGRILKISAALLIASLLIYNQSMSFLSAKEAYSLEIDSTEKPMISLALWLKNNTPENALIALHDIGVVGFFSGRKILDMVGLVNPEVGKFYQDEQLKTPLPYSERRIIDFLKEKRPDYVVLFPEWDRFFNLLQPINKKHFQLIHTTLPLFPTEMRYHVYKCDWAP